MSREKHIMVDLETLGTKRVATVLSVGACVFDPYTDYVGPVNFYKTIKWQQMIVETGTLIWWLKQENKLLNLLTSDAAVEANAIAPLFSHWLHMNYPAEKYYLWCHGLDFDQPLLQGIFEYCPNVDYAWNRLFAYNDGRDTRTIFDAARFDFKAFPRYGEFHNAIDDAITQAKAVQECYRILDLKKGELP